MYLLIPHCMRSCDFPWSLLFNINKYKYIYNLCRSRGEVEFHKKKINSFEYVCDKFVCLVGM